MTWLEQLRQLYSLDTLDTRFTISSTTPPRDALELHDRSTRRPNNETREEGAKAQIKARAQPSLWGTPEYIVYIVVILVCIPLMFKSVYDVSKGIVLRTQFPVRPIAKYSHSLTSKLS